ncbi:hypothetical protein GJW-30_1_02056 [Variibacter gotjawalensis]|uniref:Uncharacterized protein n=1 Tax=Variibacter gotjawalensis TaxID=1333996 RepID=A0A0S3PUF6_9BRAD|nr:hypothetical protein EV661_4173 [Variibacter gotjawalensis]BAT59523.1 hypothetical protein GJW-30_1_02056 [Variibacter gotjawalensis]
MRVATILSLGAVLAIGALAPAQAAGGACGQSLSAQSQTDLSAAKMKKAKKMRKSRARTMAPPDPAGGDGKRGGPPASAPGGGGR